MRSKASYSPDDIHAYDDAFHEALDDLGDFTWGGIQLRCIEFHFLRPIFRAGDRFGWHAHSEHQIEIALSGAFEFALKGNKPALIKPREVFFIPSGSTHKWRCVKSGMLLGLSLANTRLALEEHDRKALQSCAGLAPRKLGESFLRAFLDSLSQGVTARPCRAAWIYLLIDAALHQCLPSRSAALRGTGDDASGEGLLTRSKAIRKERVVSKLMRYIDANIATELKIEHLASIASVGPRQVQRLFTQSAGVGCHQYIKSRRLQVAREQLTRDPHISIKEVAYACGFSSPAHFTTSFRKAFGMTPSAYNP